MLHTLLSEKSAKSILRKKQKEKNQKATKQSNQIPPIIKSNAAYCSLMRIFGIILAVIYYPLWTVCSLIYNLCPPEIPFHQYFDSVTVNDASFVYHDQINNDKANNQREQKTQRRHKLVQSVLKIWSLNREYIQTLAGGQNEKIFSAKLQFDDPLVSYSNYTEWLVSFHTLSIVASAQITDILSIEHYESLIIIQFRIRWMSPFKLINEYIFHGVHLNDVLVIKLDETDECITNIFELWNGKSFLKLYGVMDICRRITAIFTLPFCYMTSYLMQ